MGQQLFETVHYSFMLTNQMTLTSSCKILCNWQQLDGPSKH